MENSLKRIKDIYLELIKTVDTYNFNKSRIIALNNIIDSLSSESSYEKINNDLSLLQEQLLFIFNKEKRDNYYETIKMTLIGLIKCEKNKRIYENNYEQLYSYLKEIIKALKKDLKDIQRDNANMHILHCKRQISSILRLNSLVNIGCFEKHILKEMADILSQLGFENNQIVDFLEKYKKNSGDEKTKKEAQNSLEILNYHFPKITVNIDNNARSLANNIYYELINDLNDVGVLLKRMESIDDIQVKMYLCQRIMEYYYQEYIEHKKLLEDFGIYFDELYYQETLVECKKKIDAYMMFYSIYQRILEMKGQDTTTYKYMFLNIGDNTYFEKDLYDLEPDILDAVESLLDDALDNSPLVIRKKLTFLGNLYEYKYDSLNNQIRIVFCYGKKDIPIIVGVIRKKAFSDSAQYNKMCQRVKLIKKINEDKLCESANDDLEKIKSYISTHRRKGTRK